MQLTTTFTCPDSRISVNDDAVLEVTIDVTYRTAGADLPATWDQPPEFREFYIDDIRIVAINEDENYPPEICSWVLSTIEEYWQCIFDDTLEAACRENFDNRELDFTLDFYTGEL